jgi:glycosyltransferase involved in cell wall biosynthesis
MGGYVPLIRKFSKAPIVLKAQNVEYRIWEKLTEHEQNPARKFYLRKATQALRRFESDLLQKVDGVLPLTRTDSETFVQMGCTKPQLVIPMGWDFSGSEPWFRDNAAAEVNAYHLAAMDWQPNEEAMRWFLHDVWPLILRRFPDHAFHCAGRKMPDWVAQGKFDNVRITGEVNKPYEWVSDKNVMIVPLLSGSGIRAKILEAMALGKLVISTPLGADGIEGRDREHFLLASTPAEFAEAYEWAVNHPAERRQVALAGRKLMQERYSMEACAASASRFYQSLMEHRP